MSEKLRVIMVDDDKYQLEAMKLFFDPVDEMVVSLCSSPQEALERIRRDGFDCVVTDYRMDGMSGVELVEEIRRSSDVPIIMFSMVDEQAVREAALAMGTNDYITKDSTIDSYHTLAGKIRGLAGR